ncbi:hypothetical protein DM860_001597 [Cuscuta australis]|uniref:Protein kinase domain-containing protein n=1 Tax=Cuscuta australis TaxID=267555 RepID=A0A328ECZ3_9ASTE|nr:hypothetical protein DM860_001597 [Cuscuta australis]
MGGCFPCFGSSTKGVSRVKEVAKESFKDGSAAQPNNVNKLSADKSKSRNNNDSKKEPTVAKDGTTANIAAQTFTFRELAAATKNFRSECLLGEGGFGRVYKGQLESTGQARPLFKDRRKFPKMADPLLQGRYPMRGLYQALAVAAMCLQEQAATRPLIGDVVTALTYLASQTYDPNASARVGSATPRRNTCGAHSPDDHSSSPSIRRRDSFKTGGAELKRVETGGSGGGGSARKLGMDESERSDSQRDSPVGRAKDAQRNRDIDRERAVALAKVWGENWRERKNKAGAGGSFDSTND